MKVRSSIYMVLFASLLLSCTIQAPAATLEPPAPTEVTPATLPTTRIPLPSKTADVTAIPTKTPTAPQFLFVQNFESGSTAGLSSIFQFDVTIDQDGNRVLCNQDSVDYSHFSFGNGDWADYVVQLRVKALKYSGDAYWALQGRKEVSGHGNFYGALSLRDQIASMAYSDPFSGFGQVPFKVTANTWYTARLQFSGQRSSFYIDNKPVAHGASSLGLIGKAGFEATPHTVVCVDDIHVWPFSGSGLAARPVNAMQLALEVVTDHATENNAWGGHQARIVRTADGVFTTFNTAGNGDFDEQWHLAWRRGPNDWPVIADGPAGDGPVNLLAAPDGTLRVIARPGGLETMWSGKPMSGEIHMTQQTIPGIYYGYYAYEAAGTDAQGDVCVTTSLGGGQPGGRFEWACYEAATQQWTLHVTQIDYKYAYTYVFPHAGGKLSLIATRDVLWKVLGYAHPENAFDYVFNAIGLWQSNQVFKGDLTRTYMLQSEPTAEQLYVYLDAQQDAYLDTLGNMHVLYWLQDGTTHDEQTSRHLVLSPTGQRLQDVQLAPQEGSSFARIFQDATGNFYILSSSHNLYPAGKDGLTVGNPIPLNFGGYDVEYSGFAISAPRTGTPASDVIDVAFPSANGTQWIYFELRLPGQ